MKPADPDVRLAVALASLTGESPMWHPAERALYYCDIPGRRLQRFDAASGDLVHWDFDADVACVAPRLGGGLLLAMRSGIWHFDPRSGERERVARPPYDPLNERFNDGKCDPQGRFWVGTLYEPRTPALAAVYCLRGKRLERRAESFTNCNGFGWSPSGRTFYASDTTSHTVYAHDVDPASGELSGRRVFVQFEPKRPDQPLDTYGGRPDGAAVDAEGGYWVAMFEGQRLLRFSPDGELLREVLLPVRCPTMPCFGGADLKTIYITTARQNRPAAELAEQPWAGCVLALDVDVAGLPVNFGL